MHASTGAESIHSVVLLGQRDPPLSESSTAQVGPGADGVGQRLLQTFNALAWAAIAFLFVHAVLMSVNPASCLLGCEPVAVTSSLSTPGVPSAAAE